MGAFLTIRRPSRCSGLSRQIGVLPDARCRPGCPGTFLATQYRSGDYFHSARFLLVTRLLGTISHLANGAFLIFRCPLWGQQKAEGLALFSLNVVLLNTGTSYHGIFFC